MTGCGMYTCNSSTLEVREEGCEFECEMNLSSTARTCLLKNRKKEEKEKYEHEYRCVEMANYCHRKAAQK